MAAVPGTNGTRQRARARRQRVVARPRPEVAALVERVAKVAVEERDAVDPGSVAIIAPATLVEAIAGALDDAGIDYGRAARNGLAERVTLVPVSLVKGLELDAAVVVEPAAIVDEEAQGLRALYVALTRATKRLAIVHARAAARRPALTPPGAAAEAWRPRRAGRSGGGGGRGLARADQDAGAGEGADADVAALDLDGHRAVGRGGGDRAVAAGLHGRVLEEHQQPGRELELLGDALDREVRTDAPPWTAAPTGARA